jgi:hypothetical protein
LKPYGAARGQALVWPLAVGKKALSASASAMIQVAKAAILAAFGVLLG